MPQYTFYPATPNGSILTFEARDLDGEAGAMVCAELLLAQHRSCASVAVWSEDRLLLVVYRALLPEQLRLPAEPVERAPMLA
ncbi:hypothetical protein [Phenylobacterium sp.]|jgi:hypothetical protein|uniref:hypothetical protein n=1 Tax=Phenylobacterium sp. TaxID=1871053 RepID=UPI002F949BB3